ncbi:hypothetical protein EXIGLDRAFT_845633 [Exidia glandulosa HHB12029]|uniref:SAP18-domain-containing protein n=1 Tax=Exidia glandulosa HHB12029 TaxID=1314781 RepID=A0A165BD32_EXIGL|nr:hypothetical protein EXIGLDRAFT_845633 [Exidia glandulosa HHB12029]
MSVIMDDGAAPSSIPVVDREKTAPFLVRAFVKIGGFHRVTLFDDGQLPTTDERQLFTWRDATLRELVHSLRLTIPQTPEFRHPHARYQFRALFLDPIKTRGGSVHYASKELGSISARDVSDATLPDEDADSPPFTFDREKERGEDRTLEELKFYPGDLLAVALFLPKTRDPPPPAALERERESKWSPAVAPPARGSGGGGHWRGGAPPGRGGGRDAGPDRREPPPRRTGTPPRRPISPPPGRRGASPPRRGGPPGGRGRGGFDSDRSRFENGRGRRDMDRRSRSRSPPRRRELRYD